MALTTRGKVLAAVVGLVVVGGGVAVLLAATGHDVPVVSDLVGGGDDEPKPPKCLTGVRPEDGAPRRPALAIKVENLPEARPQAGLNDADVVYEEPVEGGITRFIAVFQCHDSDRVGPVRSARLTDPPILVQFGRSTLFGYAGGVPRVEQEVQKFHLHDLSFERPDAAGAYTRDPDREAPHDLYTSTEALYEVGNEKVAPPKPVFRFGPRIFHGEDKPKGDIHLDFSASADVFWHWDPKRKEYLRSHGDEPHLLEGDEQVSARNVLVMIVKLVDTGIVDAAGNPSPEVVTVRGGKCYLFRDGVMVAGRWKRASPTAVIRYVDPNGKPLQLHPGRTWVELFPNTREFEPPGRVKAG